MLWLKQIPVLPCAVADILSERNLIKAGNAVGDDALLVERKFNVKTCPIADLQWVAKRCSVDDTPGYGIANLTRRLLNVDIPKKLSLILRGWEKIPTAEQVNMAATDAFLSRLLLIQMYRIYRNRDIEDLRTFALGRPESVSARTDSLRPAEAVPSEPPAGLTEQNSRVCYSCDKKVYDMNDAMTHMNSFEHFITMYNRFKKITSSPAAACSFGVRRKKIKCAQIHFYGKLGT